MILKITKHAPAIKGMWRMIIIALSVLFSTPASAQIIIGTGTSATLGVGTGTSSLQSPYNSYYGYSWVQTLYLRDEINASSGNITSISFNFTGTTISNSNVVKIYMANVDRSAFTSNTNWEPISGMTLVFDDTLDAAVPGLVTINLTTPFAYQSNRNLIVAVDENAADDDGTTGYMASNLGAGRVIFYRSDSNNPDPAAPPTANGLSSYVGNIQINGLTPLTCKPPTAITPGTVTATTAPFSFAAPTTSTPTSYEWEVRATGAPGSGSPVASGSTTTLSSTATGLSPTTTYSLYVRSNCGSGQFSAWAGTSFTTPASPPSNDEASAAVPLTVNTDLACAVTTNGNTLGATPSADAAPSCSASGINDDVWYKFTATSNYHQFKFSNVTSGTMAVALYTGSPGSLTGTTDCGSGTTVNFSDLVSGTEYYARMYTTTATSTTTTTFTVCLGTSLNMTYDSVTTVQASSASVGAGTVNQQILGIRVYSANGSNPLNATQFNFTTSGTITAGEITSAKLYTTGTSSSFAATTLFGTAVANPNGTFSINGSQALVPIATGGNVNYFWLTYDVNCSAVAAHTADAICNSVVVGPTTKIPVVTDPAGSRAITAASFTATTLQPSTSVTAVGGINQQILRVAVTGCTSSNITDVTFSTTGSTAVSDIANAKVYFTPTTSFATTTQFGNTVANPNGTFTVTGSQLLGATSGYLWLTYDIATNAVAGDVIDASCASVTVGGVNSIPSTLNPTGTRTIAVFPSNDECTTAIAFPTIPVDGSCASVTGKTQYATQSQASCTGDAHDDIWYSFVCPAATTSLSFAATNISGSSDMVIQFFSGTCGNLTSVLCSDPESGTLTGLTPGSTYFCRVHAYSSSSYTEMSLCLKTTQVSYISSVTEQPSTSAVLQGAPNQSIVRVNVTTLGNTGSLALTQLNFNTTGTTNVADVTNAKVYYTGTSSTFSTSTLFGNVMASPNGNFSVAGSQVLTGGSTTTSNYFFLVYDVACNATVADILDAQCTGLTVGGVAKTPTVTNPSGTRAIAAVTYTAVTTQPTSAIVPAGGINQQVLRVDVTGCSSSLVTSLSFNTTGTTNAADIVNAKVFYTTTTTFATATQFGSTVVSPNGAFTVTGSQVLGVTTGYFWLVYDVAANATAADILDASCSSILLNSATTTPATPNPSGTRAVVTPVVNDEAAGAIALTVGTACSGFPYTNVNSFQSPNEKFPDVKGTSGFNTVWFKFVAPASGMVKITNDYTGGTAGSDTKLGLFSASDSSNYATFTSLAGDDDNGIAVDNRSTIFYAGLTAGVTYYIAYDGYSNSITLGTFCITVEEMNSSMLATSGSCTASQSSAAENSYSGWRSLVSTTGLLIANVKQNAGTAGSSLAASFTLNTGAIRKDANNVPYLDRNYSFSGAVATPADVQLFFSAADFAVLNGTVQSSGGSALTLSSLNVTHQTGSVCRSNFSQANGVNSVLTQTANGSTNGMNWIQVTTPSFSNFYIMGGTAPLPLHLISFDGQNKGAVNSLNWVTAEEKDFSHFELERSANGIDFVRLDIIDAKNNATGSTYDYIDKRPLDGRNFYRLQMVDRNGNSTISQVVDLTVKGGSGFAVSVHPNPVSAIMQMTITGKVDGTPTVLILDVVGKVVKTLHPSANNISIDMSGMPAGTYVVKYFDNSNASVTKITKN